MTEGRRVVGALPSGSSLTSYLMRLLIGRGEV
jgi:hypothetical protein